MICPNCENGKVFHPMAHVRDSKYYGKHIPCRRCNGSVEDAIAGIRPPARNPIRSASVKISHR